MSGKAKACLPSHSSLVMLDSASTFPAYSSPPFSIFLSHILLTHFILNSAPPCPHAWLRSGPLTHTITPIPPVPLPTPNQGNFFFPFFFPFSHSCLPRSVIQLKFAPACCGQSLSLFTSLLQTTPISSLMPPHIRHDADIC